MDNYDYIIVGAGASGLAMAHSMSQDSFFDDKSIAIIDKVQKSVNDKTWCFWEKEVGIWDGILTKSWSTIQFKSDDFAITPSILPYHYKMIRSVNYYHKIWSVISTKSNFTFIEDDVVGIQQKDDVAEVTTKTKTFSTKVILNSILYNDNYKKQTKYPVLQQHFVGYFIKTQQPIFNDDEATFMDFSISQKDNTRFMYILPYSKTEALFEYTLFSKHLLKFEEYEAAIKTYLKEKGITEYKIIEKEHGSIPMTCYQFWKNNSENIVNIGTAGGWTKASTGYTFKNINKKSIALTNFLKSGKPMSRFYKSNRFWFYDLLLLDILYKKNELGAAIFTSMFKGTSTIKILKFLDEETTFLEELSIFLKMPKRLFTKALLKRML